MWCSSPISARACHDSGNYTDWDGSTLCLRVCAGMKRKAHKWHDTMDKGGAGLCLPVTLLDSCGKLRRDAFLSESVSALPDLVIMCVSLSMWCLSPVNTGLLPQSQECPCLSSLQVPGVMEAAISPQHSQVCHKHRLRWTETQFARANRDRGTEVVKAVTKWITYCGTSFNHKQALCRAGSESRVARGVCRGAQGLLTLKWTLRCWSMPREASKAGKHALWGSRGCSVSRRLRESLTALYNSLEGGYSEMGVSLFYYACREKTRGNGLKAKTVRFRLDDRKKKINKFHCSGGQAME